MKLTKLSLANYRGFGQLTVEFEPDVTVIAGVNGVGKSALLSAVIKCVSHALREYTHSQEAVVEVEGTDIKAGEKSTAVSASFALLGRDFSVDIVRSVDATYEEAKVLKERRDALRFTLRRAKKGSREERDIKGQIQIIDSKLRPQKDLATVRNMPLGLDEQSATAVKEPHRIHSAAIAVHYPTSRLLSRLPPRLPPIKETSPATAHANALSQVEISLNDFANWHRVLNESADSEYSQRMFCQIGEAVAGFLDGVDNLRLHSGPPPRFSVQKNGHEFFLEQLSDGERGLLALVFDLTRRLAIANPTSQDPIREGLALVLIDEVELHLHPTWQRQAVRKLRGIFANCQFIITTHSPQVIGQAQPRQLRLLNQDKAGNVSVALSSQSLGMDSSWVLQNIMGTSARDYDTEQQLARIFDAIDKSKYDQARKLAGKMRKEIGDFPDLQEASALLDRIELLEGQ